MVERFYKDRSNIIVSKLSGGRGHYPYRQPVIHINSNKYKLSYGENLHTLAQAVIGSDRLVGVIFDVNKVKDMFSWKTGDVVSIPLKIVDTTYDLKSVW